MTTKKRRPAPGGAPAARRRKPAKDDDTRAYLVPAPLCVTDGTKRGSRPPRHSSPGSPAAGVAILEAWLHPVSLDDFVDSIHQRRALHVARDAAASPFGGLLSSADVWAAVDGGLPYATGVDVVRFDHERGIRLTLNKAEGTPAPPATVRREFFKNGASLRLLHPQRWPGSDLLRATLADLEGYFESVVGCNAYFTPARAQGFAPHSDDVDVFILQLEGSKTWRLHAPHSEADILPRASSSDYGSGEAGELMLETTLQPGHLLYLPRGTAHSAATASATASLHVTISVCHRRTWADLLALALPAALEAAAAETVDLRRSLPIGSTRTMGLAHEGDAELAHARAVFVQAARRAADAVVNALPLDAAVDALAVDWVQARVPPRRCATAKAWKKGSPLPPHVMAVAGGSAARIVVEDDVIALYHCLANDAAAHAADPACRGDKGGAADASDEPAGRLEFSLGAGPALEALLSGQPVPVADLPRDEDDSDGDDEAVDDVVARLLAVGVVVPA